MKPSFPRLRQACTGLALLPVLLLLSCSNPPVPTPPSSLEPPTASPAASPMPAALSHPQSPSPTRTPLPSQVSSPQPSEAAADPFTFTQVARLGGGRILGGGWLASGNDFALQTTTGLLLYQPPEDRIRQVFRMGRFQAISPDGSQVALGERDRLQVWDADSRALRWTSVVDSGSLGALRFSPDGAYLVGMVSPPGEEVYNFITVIWNAEDGIRLGAWDIGAALDVELSPDGKYLAAWNPVRMNGIYFWQLPAGENPLVFQSETLPVDLAFSPDGSQVATAGMDGRIHIWSFPDLALKQVLQEEGQDAPASLESCLGFSPDGRFLAAAGKGSVQVWGTNDWAPIASFDDPLIGSQVLSFSPDSAVLAAGSEQGVSFWRIPDGERLDELSGFSAPIQAVALSPDGQFAAIQSSVGTEYGRLSLYHTQDGEERYTLEEFPALSLAYSADGAYLAGGLWSGAVRVVHARNGALAWEQPGFQHQVQSLAFSPVGDWLAASSMEAVSVWQVSTGELGYALQVPGGWVEQVAFSPDGERLVTLSAGGPLHIWRAADGQLLHEIQVDRQGWTGYLAFSPDGSRLALGFDDRIHLYEFPRGDLIRTWNSGTGGLNGLAFTDDSLLLSLHTGGELRVWMAANSSLRQALWLGGEGFTGFAYSSAGEVLVTGSLDGTWRLWKAGRKGQG